MGSCGWGDSAGGGLSGSLNSFYIPAELFVGNPTGGDNPPQMRDFYYNTGINVRAFSMPVVDLGGSFIQATRQMPIDIDVSKDIDMRIFISSENEPGPFPRYTKWDININSYRNDDPWNLALAGTVSFEKAIFSTDTYYQSGWNTVVPEDWGSITADCMLLFNISRGVPVADDLTVPADIIGLQVRYTRL